MKVEYRLVVKLSNVSQPLKYKKRDRRHALADMEHYLDPENYQWCQMPKVWIETREVTKWVKDA